MRRHQGILFSLVLASIALVPVAGCTGTAQTGAGTGGGGAGTAADSTGVAPPIGGATGTATDGTPTNKGAAETGPAQDENRGTGSATPSSSPSSK